MKISHQDSPQSLRQRMLATHASEAKANPIHILFLKLVGFSRWMLLIAILVSPWIYGTTRPWSIRLLNVYLLSLLLTWLVSAVLSRRAIGVSSACFWSCLALVLQGWWMTLNAKYVYDMDYSIFLDFPRFLATGPGSYDRPSSFDMMLRISALLGVIVMCMDMSQYRKWRMRLWATICIAGISIVVLGLVQKMGNAPMIFWEKGRNGHYFFGTYLYHGNAGAFINLVLPLVVGLTSLVFQKARHGAMAFLAPGTIVCIAAAFSHASKAAVVVSAFLILVMSVWQARLLWGAGQGLSQKFGNLMSASIGGVAIVTVIMAVGWHLAAQRWNLFDFSLDQRMLTYKIASSIIPGAGAFGFGPGTFSIMFDRAALAENPNMQVFFRYAHQDYLQALIEWGWVGSFFLGFIFFGAIVLAFWRCFFKSTHYRLTERILLFSCGLALLGIAMHAAVDFPLQIYSLQLYSAVFVGLIWKSSSWKTDPQHQGQHRHRSSSASSGHRDSQPLAPHQGISKRILEAHRKRLAEQNPDEQSRPPSSTSSEDHEFSQPSTTLSEGQQSEHRSDSPLHSSSSHEKSFEDEELDLDLGHDTKRSGVKRKTTTSRRKKSSG